MAFAEEGADVAIVYLKEHVDAKETKRLVEEKGRKCLILPGDVGTEKFCKAVVKAIIDQFGRLDILVNNVAETQIATFYLGIFEIIFSLETCKNKGVILN